jgi:Ca2+-transporting ATPase
VEGKAIAPLGVEAVFLALRTRPSGLAADEARARLAEHGPNALPPPRRTPALLRLAAQLTHFMALLLWGAGALSFVAGMPELGWAILAVVLLNGTLGFWQEHRADRALDALEALVPRRVRALRGGREVDVAAEGIVPGDVVVLEEGDRIPADTRLVGAERLRLDLSLLTGESAPAERSAGPDRSGRGPADATCLLPAGATVLEGRGRAVVYATGRATELGRISSLATATVRVQSTLEREVHRLVRIVTLIALAMGGAVFALVRVLGAGAYESALFAVGIVVANVPEGLLPAITITLAVNVQRMARRRALVRRLSAVETRRGRSPRTGSPSGRSGAGAPGPSLSPARRHRRRRVASSPRRPSAPTRGAAPGRAAARRTPPSGPSSRPPGRRGSTSRRSGRRRCGRPRCPSIRRGAG